MDRLGEILDGLDPAEDANWTNLGNPRISVVSERLGQQVTGEMIRAARPNFQRSR